MLANMTTVNIPINTAISNAAKINRNLLAAVIPIGGWTSAKITFSGSVDGSNFYPIFKQDGTELEITTVTVGVALTIEDMIPLSCWNWIKVRRGTNASPVTQTSARDLVLIFAENL